jgi:hypothetical protein
MDWFGHFELKIWDFNVMYEHIRTTRCILDFIYIYIMKHDEIWYIYHAYWIVQIFNDSKLMILATILFGITLYSLIWIIYMHYYYYYYYYYYYHHHHHHHYYHIIIMIIIIDFSYLGSLISMIFYWVHF